MQDEATMSRQIVRGQSKKYVLRREAAVGLLGLSLAVNIFGGAYIAQERKYHALEMESLQLDIKIANAMRDQAVAQLGAAERDKQFALDELAEMAREEQNRQAQAEAYATDTGVTGNHVDIAVMSHDEAQRRGSRQVEVWMKEENKQ